MGWPFWGGVLAIALSVIDRPLAVPLAQAYGLSATVLLLWRRRQLCISTTHGAAPAWNIASPPFPVTITALRNAVYYLRIIGVGLAHAFGLLALSDYLHVFD